jgi:hypothetical protein
MDRFNKPDEEDSLVDILQVEGVNAKGFGNVPKIVMKDKRLSLAAKGLYAYFCSYSGSGNRAFPGRSTILNDLQITKDTYYKHLDSLKLHDYIRVKQERTEGKYKRNVYILVSNPKKTLEQAFSPCPNFSDTARLPCPIFSDTINQDTNINNIGNIDNLSINHEYIDTDMMDRMEGYIQIVKENIEYDTLLDQEPNKSLVKNIFTLIIDTLCGESGTYQIGGVPMPAQQVKKRFLELDQKDVSSVILGIARLDKPIRNARNYLMTALYNAPATSQAKWTSEINSAIRQYNGKKRNV